MSFKKKIELLLKTKQLGRITRNKIERDLTLDGTLYKGLKKEDWEPDPEISKEIVRKYGIKQSWWDKDWETGSLDMFEDKPKPGNILTDNDENIPKGDPEVYRTIVEGNTEYVLMKRSIIEDAEIISKKQLDANIKNMDTIVNKLENDSKLMQLLVTKFIDTVERVLSPQPVKSQKSKHNR